MVKKKRKKVGRPPGGPDGQLVRDMPVLYMRTPGKYLKKLGRIALASGKNKTQFIQDVIENWDKTVVLDTKSILMLKKISRHDGMTPGAVLTRLIRERLMSIKSRTPGG